MNWLVQRSDVGEFRRRYRWMVLFILTMFMVLAGRLVQLQLVENDVHRAQARRNIIGEIPQATSRGVIRDAYGRVLAANRPSYNVYVVPELLDLEQTWPRLGQLMRLTPAEKQELEKKIRDAKQAPGNRASQQKRCGEAAYLNGVCHGFYPPRRMVIFCWLLPTPDTRMA